MDEPVRPEPAAAPDAAGPPSSGGPAATTRSPLPPPGPPMTSGIPPLTPRVLVLLIGAVVVGSGAVLRATLARAVRRRPRPRLPPRRPGRADVADRAAALGVRPAGLRARRRGVHRRRLRRRPPARRRGRDVHPRVPGVHGPGHRPATPISTSLPTVREAIDAGSRTSARVSAASAPATCCRS